MTRVLRKLQKRLLQLKVLTIILNKMEKEKLMERMRKKIMRINQKRMTFFRKLKLSLEAATV